MKEIVVGQVAKYGGHTVAATGVVSLTLKAEYSELVNSIQLTQLLNNDVFIKAKVPGSNPMKLGMFRVNDVNISGDGSSVIKLKGVNTYIEMNNLNLLPTKSDDGEERFQVRYEATIEEEGENNGSEEEW